jgi:thiamine biosynthesis lipoprotein
MLEQDLAAVDAAGSRFRPDSEIVALGRAWSGPAGTAGRPARTRPARVSPLLAEAIAVALEAARVTGGDVDPTVGGAMDAAGYDRDFALVPPAGPSAVVVITAGGLATSSTAARRWQRGGEVLHHILDPRTGIPVAPVWRTVSVAAASCTAANTAATAAIIRGGAAPGWLAGLGLPARLVAGSGEVLTMNGWPAEGAEQK